MVFSSVPVYLNPLNWQQQHNHPQGSGSSENPQLLPPLAPPPPHGGGGGGGGGSIRPGSMADLARLAKIPQPETALKCPRCESTNTKFCYYNNYSLSQPRHLCKTCRRYWTLGGTLRNVPVGGGYRRNKKNKSSRSKLSPAASAEKQLQVNIGSNSTNNVLIPNSEITEHHLAQQQTPPNLPSFMASLQNFPHHQFRLENIGLNFGHQAGGDDHMRFQIGSNSGGMSSSANILSVNTGQQFPNFFEQTNAGGVGLYPFQISEGMDASRVSEIATAMKMENTNRSSSSSGLNLSRSLNMGVSEYWGSENSSWTTDLSALNSSTTTNNNNLL